MIFNLYNPPPLLYSSLTYSSHQWLSLPFHTLRLSRKCPVQRMSAFSPWRSTSHTGYVSSFTSHK